MTWKGIVGSLIRCEISASYDWMGQFRVSARGALAVIVFALLVTTLVNGGI